MAKKKKRKLGYLHPLYVPQGIERVVTLAGQIFGKVGKIERSLATGDQAGPYRYFVSFHYYNPPDLIGFSNRFVELENPIDQADIRKFEESFDYLYGKVVVLNFILLDPEK